MWMKTSHGKQMTLYQQLVNAAILQGKYVSSKGNVFRHTEFELLSNDDMKCLAGCYADTPICSSLSHHKQIHMNSHSHTSEHANELNSLLHFICHIWWTF